MTNQLLQLLQQQTAAFAQQQTPTPRVGNFKTFQFIHPPEFVQTADPIKAKSWLKETEKGFCFS